MRARKRREEEEGVGAWEILLIGKFLVSISNFKFLFIFFLFLVYILWLRVGIGRK